MLSPMLSALVIRNCSTKKHRDPGDMALSAQHGHLTCNSEVLLDAGDLQSDLNYQNLM